MFVYKDHCFSWECTIRSYAYLTNQWLTSWTRYTVSNIGACRGKPFVLFCLMISFIALMICHFLCYKIYDKTIRRCGGLGIMALVSQSSSSEFSKVAERLRKRILTGTCLFAESFTEIFGILCLVAKLGVVKLFVLFHNPPWKALL